MKLCTLQHELVMGILGFLPILKSFEELKLTREQHQAIARHLSQLELVQADLAPDLTCNVTQAAEVLARSKQRVRALLEEGKIEGYQQCRRAPWVVFRRSLDEYCSGQRAKASQLAGTGASKNSASLPSFERAPVHE